MTDYYQNERTAAAYDHEPELPVDDVPFYVELAREAHKAGLPVLELACGTGRVTIPIAQTGARITGLDNSPYMLEVARRKAEGIENVRWVEGSMAGFALEERYGLVIIPYRSFLILLTVEEQKSCLRAIYEHLVPGGRLALNFFNPSISIIGDWLGPRRGSQQRQLTFRTPDGREATSWQTNHYETAQQQLDHLRITEEQDESGVIIARVYRNLRLRYVFRYEMQHLLELAGFEVEALYGWFDRRPFTDESNEMVWIAQKPV